MKILVQHHTGKTQTLDNVTDWKINYGVLEVYISGVLTMAFPPGQWSGAVRVMNS
jgi:hypothetical protein